MTNQTLYDLLALLDETEGIQLEPSALAGMLGPILVTNNGAYINHMNFKNPQLNNTTHLVWAKGGSMVPTKEMQTYLSKRTIV